MGGESDNPHFYQAAAYIRVTALAFAFYDFVETYPSVLRYYRDQWRLGKLWSLSSVLFIAIRLSSITILVLSNVGFFSKFTEEGCRRYYLIPPAFKIIQGMISHLILGVRAYNVSRRNKLVGIIMGLLYVTCCTLEWITTLIGRTHKVDPVHHYCKQPSPTNSFFSAWIYYVLAIVFDFTATSITVYYLVSHHKSSSSSKFTSLSRMMLKDGIGYFVVLTAANVVNMVFWQWSKLVDMQNAASSLQYAVTWILSQRLLLHIYNASVEKRDDNIGQAVTITQGLLTAKSVNHALRSQFERKNDALELTVPDFTLDLEEARDSLDDNGGVSVRIERTVRMARNPRAYELENYSRPSYRSSRPSRSATGRTSNRSVMFTPSGTLI